ncbi:isochorismatase family protein [bacterium]|nr:isochorismatase family protein [bacterium]
MSYSYDPATIKKWLSEIAPFNRRNMKLEPPHSALLVVDMQNYFVEPGGNIFLKASREILPQIKCLLGAFRKAKLPVIYTRHEHHPDGRDAGAMGWWWKDMIKEGSTESQICSQIAPLPDDKVITKHRYSAFYNTDLEIILRGAGIKDLLIAGVMTNLCCETTAREAFMRDFRVFFLADATASMTEQMHLASLLNLAYGFASITTTEDVLKTIFG